MDVTTVLFTLVEGGCSRRGDDITLAVLWGNDDVESLTTTDDLNVISFLIRTMGDSVESPSQGEGLLSIKLARPSSDGYLSRANFFGERMVDYPLIVSVAGVIAPLERVAPCASSDEHNAEKSSLFLNQVAAAIGAPRPHYHHGKASRNSRRWATPPTDRDSIPAQTATGRQGSHSGPYLDRQRLRVRSQPVKM